MENFKANVITLHKTEDYEIQDLEKHLISIGYKKTETVTNKGEFSKRGDILDVFNVIDENPTRFDFFDTTLENIYSFDFLTFDKLNNLNSLNIVPNKVSLISEEEKSQILSQLNELKIENNLIYDLISAIELNEDIPLEFLYPFTNSIKNFAEINYPIIISNPIQFETIYKNIYNDYCWLDKTHFHFLTFL